MDNPNPCKKCQQVNKKTRNRWNYQNNCYYLQSTCADCERKATKEHQENNRDYWRKINRDAYVKKNGPLIRRSPLEMTEDLRRELSLQKALLRATRAKQARVDWNKELTDFVYSEAHKLRRMRNTLFDFDWHVDHIVPLKGRCVCGLHVWNNFAVIPKVENLRKGNNHSVHD